MRRLIYIVSILSFSLSGSQIQPLTPGRPPVLLMTGSLLMTLPVIATFFFCPALLPPGRYANWNQSLILVGVVRHNG